MATGRLIGSTKAAQLVGVAVPTLHSFHGKRLKAKKNDLGNWVYEQDEVVAFAKWYQKTRPRFKRRHLTDGEKCAKAFAAFEAGFLVSDVVVHVEMEVERVERWFAQWQLDKKGIERGPATSDLIEHTELETKKTKLQIAREELALKRGQRDLSERRAMKRMRKNELDDAPSPPNDDEGPVLSDVFAEAAGLKKS